MFKKYAVSSKKFKMMEGLGYRPAYHPEDGLAFIREEEYGVQEVSVVYMESKEGKKTPYVGVVVSNNNQKKWGPKKFFHGMVSTLENALTLVSGTDIPIAFYGDSPRKHQAYKDWLDKQDIEYKIVMDYEACSGDDNLAIELLVVQEETKPIYTLRFRVPCNMGVHKFAFEATSPWDAIKLSELCVSDDAVLISIMKDGVELIDTL